MPAHEAAVLERHPVRLRELDVGNGVDHLRGEFVRLAKALGIEGGKPLEAGASKRRHLLRRVVGAKEALFVVVVERYQRGDAARHARVAGQRGMLRPGELQPAPQRRQRRRSGSNADTIERQNGSADFHHS
jgi:hypothetical protein